MTKSAFKFALSMLVASGPAIAQGNAVIVVPMDSGSVCQSTTIAADGFAPMSTMGKAFSSLDRNPRGGIDDPELQAGDW